MTWRCLRALRDACLGRASSCTSATKRPGAEQCAQVANSPALGAQAAPPQVVDAQDPALEAASGLDSGAVPGHGTASLDPIGPPDPATHALTIATCANVRELGDYDTPFGPTRLHRFLRAGDTCAVSADDARRLCAYGVAADADLRSSWELEHAPDLLGSQPHVRYRNVQLHAYNLREGEPDLPDDERGYLMRGYLAMLKNHSAVRELMSFFASADEDECVLFHCAAGMDRTGVVSLLLLGLCEVSREDLLRDYLYSFAPPSLVERLVRGEEPSLEEDDWGAAMLAGVMDAVIDWLLRRYGSVRGYLLACGCDAHELDAVRRHLVGA